MASEIYTIRGIPMAQGRVRFAKHGKFMQKYDDPKSVEHKENLRAQIAAQNPVLHRAEPVFLYLTFEVPRPKDHYGKKGLKLGAPYYHTKTPDLDNLVKAVKDAGTGLLWHDDSLIVHLNATKHYGEEPSTRIEVRTR